MESNASLFCRKMIFVLEGLILRGCSAFGFGALLVSLVCCGVLFRIF
jgi:hypothetical protein